MTVTLSASDRQQLLERFVRYVQVDTRADEASTTSPSSDKQKDLSRLLVAELHELGLADAAMNDFGYVFATIPSTVPADHPAAGKVPALGYIAHVDTYYGTSGSDVKPQVIESYAGGDIRLNPEVVLEAASNPNLARCLGHTLVHTDGTTLLGADDKAGIAEIMTIAAWLQAHPEHLHGTLRIGFTTDEEVGRGTEHFDVKAFAADYAYTFDGSDLGEIEDETFCADSATVTITGTDVHPGYAKGKMVNAARVAAAIVAALDQRHLPETTEKREPYLHPHTIAADVTNATVKLLVRAFSVEELSAQENALRAVVSAVGERFPGVVVEVTVTESYRNMAYKIKDDPKVLDYAIEAVERLGVTPVRQAIRGGTDGSRLSYMGLLTPNIWAGGQNFHSVREWVSLEWMAKAVEAGLELLTVWVEKSAR